MEKNAASDDEFIAQAEIARTPTQHGNSSKPIHLNDTSGLENINGMTALFAVKRSAFQRHRVAWKCFRCSLWHFNFVCNEFPAICPTPVRWLQLSERSPSYWRMTVGTGRFANCCIASKKKLDSEVLHLREMMKAEPQWQESSECV